MNPDRNSTDFREYVEQLERDPQEKAALDEARRRYGDDCPGCGAPAGYPPAGPCDNHGTAEAIPLA